VLCTIRPVEQSKHTVRPLRRYSAKRMSFKVLRSDFEPVLRPPIESTRQTGNLAARTPSFRFPLFRRTAMGELQQFVGSDRAGESRLRAIASTGSAVLDGFIDQHYERRTVTIARSKLHSMNRLNIAAFTNVKADFDIGWILL